MVAALQALRGVQDTVAITTLAEIGDLTRFDNPRQLATYLGLTPSEHTTGGKRRFGSITKTGNGHTRRALVEGAWVYRFPAKVSESIQKRLEKVPQPIQDIAWKAQLRLCQRYRRMIARGKHRRHNRLSCLERGRRLTDIIKVVTNPRISAGSTVEHTVPASSQALRISRGQNMKP